ncbi:MAG: glycosyltransferase family 39 protein [Prevotellaceae bacterium]|jgi:4-amino-4-deoxy-L-arabinose transferase-like glycosyltransferase|nr:glycosyltransferase family 39 protein [Prevotellaceae bacterium]
MYQYKLKDRFLIFLLGVWWLANLFQASFMELHFDEAYYWMFSRHLDWGYFDHPPMTALLIWLGSLFNSNELGVRLLTTLLQPVYLYLFWTLLRTPEAGRREATLYVLLCAAVPMVQVYGFVATPDAPLMFFTALILVLYRKFTTSSKLVWTVLFGLCMGLMAYAKYHGALVVLCLVLSNLSLLRNRRFYAAALLAALVMLPHLCWQDEHDWVSFRYHLMDRNNTFRAGYVREYLLNIVGCYNPFLVLPFIYVAFKSKVRHTLLRPVYFIAGGFFLFFLLATLRGYVQPQWTLPMAYSIVFALYLYGAANARMGKYLIRVGWVTLALLLVVRVLIMTGALSGTKLVFFNNKATNQRIAQAANGAPVLFLKSYQSPSLYAFYTRQPSDSQKALAGRQSQYTLWSLDAQFKGQRVMVQLPAADSVVELPRGRKFFYTFVDDYIPLGELRQMEAQPDFRPELLAPTLLRLLHQFRETP